jgi:hypothetical protein
LLAFIPAKRTMRQSLARTDNEWSSSVWSCDGRSYTCDDSDFDLAMQSMVWPQRYGHKGRVDSSRVFLS